VEGIFRVSGNQAEIKQLKKKMIKGDSVDLSKIYIHNVAGILKSALAEMPDCLFTVAKYNDFVQTTKMEDKNARGIAIRAILASVPPRNKELIIKFMFFINEVRKNFQVTKMDTKNLSIIFAPILLRQAELSDEPLKGGSSTEDFLKETNIAVKVVTDIIENFEHFLGEQIEKEPAYSIAFTQELRVIYDKQIDDLQKQLAQEKQKYKELEDAYTQQTQELLNLKDNLASQQNKGGTMKKMSSNVKFEKTEEEWENLLFALYSNIVLCVKLDGLSRGKMVNLDKQALYEKIKKQKIPYTEWSSLILKEVS